MRAGGQTGCAGLVWFLAQWWLAGSAVLQPPRCAWLARCATCMLCALPADRWARSLVAMPLVTAAELCCAVGDGYSGVVHHTLSAAFNLGSAICRKHCTVV